MGQPSGKRPNVSLYRLTLYKGNVINAGISSDYSLYNEDLGSMDKAGGYHPIDCKGFININAIRLMASAVRDARN